jgi:hypothetical protein
MQSEHGPFVRVCIATHHVLACSFFSTQLTVPWHRRFSPPPPSLVQWTRQGHEGCGLPPPALFPSATKTSPNEPEHHHIATMMATGPPLTSAVTSTGPETFLGPCFTTRPPIHHYKCRARDMSRGLFFSFLPPPRLWVQARDASRVFFSFFFITLVLICITNRLPIWPPSSLSTTPTSPKTPTGHITQQGWTERWSWWWMKQAGGRLEGKKPTNESFWTRWWLSRAVGGWRETNTPTSPYRLVGGGWSERWAVGDQGGKKERRGQQNEGLEYIECC